MKVWYKMLSHPSHLIVHSITVQVVPPSCCDADSAPWWWILELELFGTFPDLVSRFCQNLKSVIHWRFLGMFVPSRPLYHISQTPNLTCIDGHLSMFVPLLYPCSHGPAQWTCWCCSWPPCSSVNSLQVAAAKSSSYHLKTPTFGRTMWKVIHLF